MKIKYDERGLVPMIIQDANDGTVLSLFYADERAIRKTERTGYVWRYSRSKKRVMKKGEQSGNTQKVASISEDCDGDALLVKVIPNGPACHKGTVSCFGSSVVSLASCLDFSILCELVDVIRKRKLAPIRGSYTSKIIRNRNEIAAKLREECEELIEAEGKENLAWEAADLLYFMLVYLENRGLDFSQVLKELRRRRSSGK